MMGSNTEKNKAGKAVQAWGIAGLNFKGWSQIVLLRR